MARPSIDFALSIDTEEEWDWSQGISENNTQVDNISQLPAFQEFCARLGIVPTYFVDYAVVSDENSVATLNSLNLISPLEFGAHMHAWVNPPLTKEPHNPHIDLLKMGESLFEQKLQALTDIISRKLGSRPTSFRSGRWGLNSEILNILNRNAYQVDSSILPFYRGREHAFDYEMYLPYQPSLNDITRHDVHQMIVELPVTAGFSRCAFNFWNKVFRLFEKAPYNYLKLIGILWQLNLVKKIYLSPELANAEQMIQLIDRHLAMGNTFFHMFMHSSSLLIGKNQYVYSSEQKQEFLNSIEIVVAYLHSRATVNFCSITSASERFRGLARSH